MCRDHAQSRFSPNAPCRRAAGAAIYASVADESQVDAAIEQITTLLASATRLLLISRRLSGHSQQAILDVAGQITAF